MDGRNVTAYFLVLLVFLGNSNIAAAECWETTSSSPICVGFLCKGTCWIGAKIWKAKVKVHKCMGSTLSSSCYCYYCDNKP
uniref:Knottin scorpion toxin-like domain-containing protein n=1 Tax=Oryza nivara TaxID=4536 RepID=A0A0E0HBI1_ORYNI